MSKWDRIRDLMALGADAITIASGLGLIAVVVVGLSLAFLRLSEPWFALLLIGVFLLVAGVAGRVLRYLPAPEGSRAHTGPTVPQAGIPPVTRVVRTGLPVPFPPIGVEARPNGAHVYLAVTNRDLGAVDIFVEAMELRGVFPLAALPWPMLWLDGGHATRSMRADETQILTVCNQRRVAALPASIAHSEFVLQSPMGEYPMRDVPAFTLRIRAHYGDEHTDYGIEIKAMSPNTDDLTCTAAAYLWDSR